MRLFCVVRRAQRTLSSSSRTWRGRSESRASPAARSAKRSWTSRRASMSATASSTTRASSARRRASTSGRACGPAHWACWRRACSVFSCNVLCRLWSCRGRSSPPNTRPPILLLELLSTVVSLAPFAPRQAPGRLLHAGIFLSFTLPLYN